MFPRSLILDYPEIRDPKNTEREGPLWCPLCGMRSLADEHSVESHQQSQDCRMHMVQFMEENGFEDTDWDVDELVVAPMWALLREPPPKKKKPSKSQQEPGKDGGGDPEEKRRRDGNPPDKGAGGGEHGITA